MRLKHWACFLVVLPVWAQARVFDINKESFASYISFNGGSSNVGEGAFESETSQSLTYSSKVKYNYSGEFGFLYSTPYANFRFGFEIIKPQSLTNVVASNSSGAELYSVKSELTGIAPKAGMEITLRRSKDSRSMIVGHGGMASLTMTNDYILTSAGQAAFSGVADHSVQAKASAVTWGGGIAHESLLSDTTTLMLEAGYRSLKFDRLKYTKDVTTFSGAKTVGDAVTMTNGENRTLDFSSYYVTLALRIYLF